MGGPYEGFVANLSWNTSSDDLAEAFNHVGPIVFARVIYKYGRSRGFGFVRFGNARSQQAAIEYMNCQSLHGREIYVVMPYERDLEPGHTWSTLKFDGASRGNPGRGGAGAVLLDPDQRVIKRRRQYLGSDVSSNEAEYRALIMGLKMALQYRVDRLEICGDSELVIRQVQGSYRVRSRRLHPLHCEVLDLLRHFEERPLLFTIPRADNAAADRLANDALDLCV